MQKISIVLLFSFLFYNNLAFGQRESKEIVLNKGENSTKILSSNPNGLVVEINTNSFRQFIETIGNEEFYTVILENGNLIEEKGYPRLPKIVKDICIPQMTDIQYRIVESEFIDVEIQIIPSKGILLRKINSHDIMYTFAEVYSKDSFFPKERLEFSTPYLMRNTRGSTLTIYPFAYNPIKKVLRVYTKLILEILFEGENENNSISNSFYEKNKYFEPILRNHFINYNTKSAFYDSDNHKNRGQSVFLNSVDETGSMLIITSDAFYDKVLPLANHKINAGLPMVMIIIQILL